MNVSSDLRNHSRKPKVITAAASMSRGDGRADYADIELPGTSKASDFDMATIAIVASIIVFKLLMLSVLIVGF